MWKMPSENDLNQSGSLFAADAFIRKEYVEIYELIKKKFEQGKGTALVRGSSGTGKSAFLQYLVARIREDVKDVLVVRGSSYDSNSIEYLHLSTGWFGQKTSSIITKKDAKIVQAKCSWTIVDGCDWEPIANCTVGAASPSTPWKGFRKVRGLVQICMPSWPISQLENCAVLTDGNCDPSEIRENYQLIGGIARWALGPTSDVLDQVDSAVKGVDFAAIKQVMAMQHASKSDEKEVVHRLVLWKTPMDQNGNWIYEVNAKNQIRYALLSDFVVKELAKKGCNFKYSETQIADL